MRPALALLLAALPLLAGCATPIPGPAASGDAPAAEADVLPWSLTRCRYVVGWSAADPAKLQARLPEGFAVARGALLGVAASPVAQLGVEAFACESGSGLDGEVAPMTYGSLFVTVVPPDELRVEGVDLYMMKWDVLVPDAPRRDALLARGLPVHAGDAEAGDGALPGSSTGRLSLEGVGDFVLSLDAPQAGPAPDATAEFIEFTPDGAGGLAAWHATYAWEDAPFATGRGVIEWPAGSWAADAVGATRAPGQFHAGTWSFNGTLTLPPARQG